MTTIAERFLIRFAGLERAHGVYKLASMAGRPENGQKVNGDARTVLRPITTEDWERHLVGECGVGVIPIRNDASCVFGAIDIDEYGTADGLRAAAEKAALLKLPLVTCRSKSGGAHLYLFLRDKPVNAELVRRRLMEWAAALGYGGVEVFPKQIRLASTDVGNWINMPYFGGARTNRYALRADGAELRDPEEFLNYVDQEIAINAADLEAFTLGDPEHDGLLEQAPPCLQCLGRQKVGEGSRNSAMFNFAVYLRKRYGESWEDHLDEYNQEFMDSPLGHRELAQVARSVGKKEYNYMCREQPIKEFCEKRTCLSRRFGVNSAGDRAEDSEQGDPAGGKKIPLSTRLLRAVSASRAEVWHTPDKRPFVTLPGEPATEHLPLKSLDLRRWLVELCELACGRYPSASVIADVLLVLDSRASREGDEYEIYVRAAANDGALFLDLGTPSHEVVAIRSDGWQVSRDQPVRFFRPPSLKPLPRPTKGGSVSLLRPFLNLRQGPEGDVDFQLVVGFILAAVRASGPYPLLMIQGEQGSAKSTFARVLRELIDPGVAGLRTPPNDERDLVIAATNSHLLAYDNVSHVKYDISDALCRLATGSGLGTRQLYTDADEQLFEVCRPAILNGIPELATRSDLRDRSIVLVLPAIPDAQRRDEGTFWREFNEVKALILGALCDALSSALREFPRTKLSALPRMADFVRWVTAAESALGWPAGSFLAAYHTSRDETAVLSVEHDVVARAVWEAASEAGGLEDTPSGMLELLRTKVTDDVARSREWPDTPRTLTDRLKRAAPDLRRIGYEVEFGRGHERWIRVNVRSDARQPPPKRELPM